MTLYMVLTLFSRESCTVMGSLKDVREAKVIKSMRSCKVTCSHELPFVAFSTTVKLGVMLIKPWFGQASKGTLSSLK